MLFCSFSLRQTGLPDILISPGPFIAYVDPFHPDLGPSWLVSLLTSSAVLSCVAMTMAEAYGTTQYLLVRANVHDTVRNLVGYHQKSAEHRDT